MWTSFAGGTISTTVKTPSTPRYPAGSGARWQRSGPLSPAADSARESKPQPARVEGAAVCTVGLPGRGWGWCDPLVGGWTPWAPARTPTSLTRLSSTPGWGSARLLLLRGAEQRRPRPGPGSRGKRLPRRTRGASRVQTPGPRCVLRAYPSCVRTSTGPRQASGPGGSQRSAWRGSSSPVQALSLGADLCSINAWSCAPDHHPCPAPTGSSPGLWREQPSGSASPRPTWRQGLGQPGALCCLGAQ